MNDRARRKELIRDYKETSPPMGIYRIRDTTSGRSIIGSSLDVSSRLNRHRAQLRMGVHPDRALQDVWTEHGAEAVVFEVLDTLEPSDREGYDPRADLAELQAMWREKLGEH